MFFIFHFIHLINVTLNFHLILFNSRRTKAQFIQRRLTLKVSRTAGQTLGSFGFMMFEHDMKLCSLGLNKPFNGISHKPFPVRKLIKRQQYFVTCANISAR